ncbi:MAG: efflux RND transporter periplasmic adaptor subunit [Candidatus Thiodiazotropha sp.]
MNDKTIPHQRRLWIAVAALVAITTGGATLLSLRSSAAEAPTSPAQAQATPATVATIAEHQVTTWREFSGRLEAVEHVDIRSRVAGTVQAVHFREGGLVKQGDLLITIDPAPYAAETDRAQAQVVSAEAKVALANSDYQRARRLWKTKTISEQELDTRLNTKRDADAQLRAARADLQSAKLNLGYTAVRAPIAGRMGKLEITVGNLVGAGPDAPVLTTLVSVDPIYAGFDADEQVVASTLADLPPGGDPAELKRVAVEMTTAGSDDTGFSGHLQLVDNQVDSASGTVRLRAVFANPDGRLMPGQFARLRMGSAKPERALLISERAVGTDQDKRFVLVVGPDNKAEYREVTLGDTTVDGKLVVKTGLKAGERIVVNGLQKVHPGSLIAPQPVDEPQVARNP